MPPRHLHPLPTHLRISVELLQLRLDARGVVGRSDGKCRAKRGFLHRADFGRLVEPD